MTGSAPIGVLHYVEEQIYKAQKAMIAAKFNGLALTSQKFDIAKEGKKPAFLAMNPVAKVPFLETDMGCIASSNAIARYVARCRADTGLYGSSFDDEGQIDTWMEFSSHELEVPLAVWVYPVLGVMEAPPASVTENAKNDVKKALKVMEDHLKTSEYLVGDFVSLADIVLVCALKEGFTRVFDPAFRKPFPKVCAWFECCAGLPQFSSILGKVQLCTQAQKPQAVKAIFAPPARAAPAPAAKKDDKKAAASAPAAKEAAPKAKASQAAPAATDAALTPAQEAEIKKVGDEIRTLKEKLKGEGLKGGDINKHPEIEKLVKQLSALKAGGAAPGAAGGAAPAAAKASPKAAPAPAPAGGGATDAQVTALGDEIRALKEKLKGEGLSGKKINDHPEVKEKVAKLQELKASGGAAPAAAPAPAPAAAPAPAPASGGGVEAQITALGDEIRALKEKLKGEGLSGKKMNDHPEVKEKVAKLQELKAKQ